MFVTHSLFLLYAGQETCDKILTLNLSEQQDSEEHNMLDAHIKESRKEVQNLLHFGNRVFALLEDYANK